MKILRAIIMAIISFIAIALIAAIFVKKEYHVERQVNITQPVDKVFNYIKYLKNQDEFSKWAKMDTAMQKTFKGTDATVGFVSAWKSNVDSVGEGEQEIKKIDINKRIDYELRFKKPFESTEQAYMLTDSTANGTKVTWAFNGRMPYPMNLMFLFMNMEDMIGNDLQVGLNNLKEVLEKK